MIYMHRISDIRVGGISRRNMRMFQNMCRANSLKNVFIVTTMWNSVTEEVGASREQELRDKIFKPFLDNGAHLVRHSDKDSFESAGDIVVQLLQNDPVALLIQQELSAGKNIMETAAGSELNAELERLVETHQAEIEKVRQEMLVAIQEADKEGKQWLLEERQKLEDEAMRWELDRQKLREDLEAERVNAAQMKDALEMAFKKERKELEERVERDKKEMESRLQQEKEALQVKLQHEAQERQAQEHRINETLAQERSARQAEMEQNNRMWQQRQEQQAAARERQAERRAEREREREERKAAQEMEWLWGRELARQPKYTCNRCAEPVSERQKWCGGCGVHFVAT